MKVNLFPLPKISKEEMIKNNKEILKKLSPIVPRQAWSVRAPRIVEVESDLEKAVLKDFNQRPFFGVAERCKSITLAGIETLSMDRGIVIFEKLVADGFTKNLDLQLSARGRKTKFYFLTAKGRIKAQLLPATDSGRGGRSLQHRFIQNLIAKRLQDRNFNTTVEGDINGKKVDVKVIDPENNRKVSIEVMLSTENTEYMQAIKNLFAGYERVVIVCLDTKSLKLVQKNFSDNIDKNPDHRITICLLWHVMQCDFKEIYEYKNLVYEDNKKKGF